MRVAASVDPVLGRASGGYADLASALAGGAPDVMVDFTHPETVFANAGRRSAAGCTPSSAPPASTREQVAELRALAEAGPANALIAPNFAVGAVLMMRFAAEASRHMREGRDHRAAPRRQARRPLGHRAAHGGPDGGRPVPIHSVRLPGLVAHQEVILGGHDETLTIRHDSLSRESFMPGVVLAVRAVAERPGLTLGLEPILFGG